MKRTIFLLLTYFTLLTPAVAEVTEYDFELIIFEDTSGRYANSEQWEDHIPEELAGNTTTVDTGIETSPVINISDIEGIGLDVYAKKLEKNKRYKILVHKAWRQTGLADDSAIDIPIDSRPDQQDTTSTLVPNLGFQSEQPPEVNNIHGSIKVVLGRYLHLYTDLVYQQPRSDSSPIWQGQFASRYKDYPIKFHRRMRSKELHYLDHPLVGIIVMALPVENQKETENKPEEKSS